MSTNETHAVKIVQLNICRKKMDAKDLIKFFNAKYVRCA